MAIELDGLSGVSDNVDMAPYENLMIAILHHRMQDLKLAGVSTWKKPSNNRAHYRDAAYKWFHDSDLFNLIVGYFGWRKEDLLERVEKVYEKTKNR